MSRSPVSVSSRSSVMIFAVVLLFASAQGLSFEESIFNLGPKLHHHFLEVNNRQIVPENVVASPLGLGVGLGLLRVEPSLDVNDLFPVTGSPRDYLHKFSEDVLVNYGVQPKALPQPAPIYKAPYVTPIAGVVNNTAVTTEITPVNPTVNPVGTTEQTTKAVNPTGTTEQTTKAVNPAGTTEQTTKAAPVTLANNRTAKAVSPAEPTHYYQAFPEKDIILDLNTVIFKERRVLLNKDLRVLANYSLDSSFENFSPCEDPQQRQEKVNSWAERVTRGLIKEFPIPNDSPVVVANSVYFEGDWVDPFSSRLTRKYNFYPTPNPSTHIKNVSYLQGQLEDTLYYEDSQLQMTQMDYQQVDRTKRNVVMFVILPKANHSLDETINQMSFQRFRDIVQNRMVQANVNVRLPKVNLQQNIDVLEVMEQMRNNQRPPFAQRPVRSTNRTTTEPPVPVDCYLPKDPTSTVVKQIMHLTVLEVNEKGTKAASITGGTMNYDGFSKNMRMERPYLMMVYDKVNHVVLFWAAIYKPT